MKKTEKTEHIEVDRLYRGLRYIVRLRDRGFRCGYIQIPQEDQEGWKKIQTDDGGNAFLCHGGISFCSDVRGCPDDFLPPGRWIGFDCMHAGDGYDIQAVEKLIGPSAEPWRRADNRPAVTSEEVEKQCRDLIDQYKTGVHLK